VSTRRAPHYETFLSGGKIIVGFFPYEKGREKKKKEKKLRRRKKNRNRNSFFALTTLLSRFIGSIWHFQNTANES